MKNLNATLWFAVTLFSATLFTFSCSDNDDSDNQDVVPERFGLDVPDTFQSSISGNRVASTTARTEDDIDGNGVYELLGFFISLGEESSNIVEEIINAIRPFGLLGPTSLSYESDDDGRLKNLELTEGASYEGVDYEYVLLITDSDSEGNDDKGNAMQIFWNRSPIEGVAILKPYNLDRVENAENESAIFKIEYSETGNLGYESHMIVSITGLQLEDAEEDPYSVDNLKMFVGRNDDTFDLYGNSNHPNASFFSEETGFNWAFVGSALDSRDLGVSEVGLPPSTLSSTSREEILKEYSIKQVFTDQILGVFPSLDQESLDPLLVNTEAPAYFDQAGFIQGGESPGDDWNELSARILELTPFSPLEIQNLTIEFQ